MTSIIFYPLAEQELVDAANYYKEQNQGLGLAYLAEVEGAVNLLMRYPTAGVVVRGSVRRLILPKFPYSLLYRVVNDLIRILAIAHHKRNPSTGLVASSHHSLIMQRHRTDESRWR